MHLQLYWTTTAHDQVRTTCCWPGSGCASLTHVRSRFVLRSPTKYSGKPTKRHRLVCFNQQRLALIKFWFACILSSTLLVFYFLLFLLQRRCAVVLVFVQNVVLDFFSSLLFLFLELVCANVVYCIISHLWYNVESGVFCLTAALPLLRFFFFTSTWGCFANQFVLFDHIKISFSIIFEMKTQLL